MLVFDAVIFYFKAPLQSKMYDTFLDDDTCAASSHAPQCMLLDSARPECVCLSANCAQIVANDCRDSDGYEAGDHKLQAGALCSQLHANGC